MKEKRSKTDRNRNIAPDRISELPESIIHEQILPRLSRSDRARTRVLSTTWYTLNKTYPALDFDFESFLVAFQKQNPKYRDASYFEISRSRKFGKSLKSFRKRASKRLRHFSRRALCLNSLRLKFSEDKDGDYLSDIGIWVESALKIRVEKLKLYAYCPDCHHTGFRYIEPIYPLPQPVYFSATLTTLKLVKCSLDQPLSLFTRIKELTLVRCSLLLNGGAPVAVLKRPDCPALESLTLDQCDGFESLCITDLVRLSRVVLYFGYPVRVEIASQRVEKISFSEIYHPVPPQFRMKMDDCCRCLKFLYLDSVAVRAQDIHFILLEFPLLEELYVCYCAKLEALKVSSSRLKTLVVVFMYHLGLQSIDIDVPTLKNLMFISPHENRIEIRVQEASRLETLVLHSRVMTDGEFHELVAKFPLLQSLWINGSFSLERIEIPPNLQQLKRLHIAKCFGLKGVKVVGSCCHKLFEMCCCGCDDLESIDTTVCSPQSLKRRDGIPDCKTCLWSVSFREMLMSLVKEKFVVEQICGECFCCR